MPDEFLSLAAMQIGIKSHDRTCNQGWGCHLKGGCQAKPANFFTHYRKFLKNVTEEENSPKVKCPIRRSELSRRWQTSSSGAIYRVAQTKWACSVRGGDVHSGGVAALLKTRTNARLALHPSAEPGNSGQPQTGKS